MTSKSHWTPTYLYNRTTEVIYRKMHPTSPWLARSAIELLDGFLRPTDVGLEFGSGTSTRWFAQRIGSLTSVEHHAEWYQTVKKMLADEHLDNTELIFVEKQNSNGGEADHMARYAGVADRFADESLDIALVDGIYREACALKVLPKIRTGGILIINDANRYLPANSQTPHARRPEAGPKSAEWQEILDQVSHWRRLWTSNGVRDTVMFLKVAK